MGLITARRTIGLKIESTPYTIETLAATDYDLSAHDISYTPEIAEMARKLARGDFSWDPSVHGKRSVTISFQVDVAYSGTAATAPPYYDALRCCGMAQTTHDTDKGVSLVPHSDYSNVPCTIEVVEKDEGTSAVQVVVMARGCMGNPKFIMNTVGEPVKIEFEFKGALSSIEDRSFATMLVPTGFNTTMPEAVLGASITAFTESRTIDTVTIDLGNEVNLFSDPDTIEGYGGAHITGRNPTIEMDSDLDLIANSGDYARWTDDTTGAFSMDVGDHITISAPAIQITTAYTGGDREGHVLSSLGAGLKRSSGNDEFEILQGSKT